MSTTTQENSVLELLQNDHTEFIEVYGAREHNLKNIDVRFKRDQLVVITGISGSGKSSLAFDTIYAEGQRRYMESFSAYARSFLGDMERPDVDKINGLSPVISIEQKTTSRNPRSTVGTVTEVYDFMRLLFARAGIAYSYLSGEKMEKQTEEQIFNYISSYFDGQKAVILAPVVKGRKGHYRELFVQIAKMGYTKVRIDGDVLEVVPKMQVDRYKIHDIEIVIDRIVVSDKEKIRLNGSIKTALQRGNGVMMILDEAGELHHFSKNLMDAKSGLAYDDPAPNMFSFNSPYGACSECNGLGVIEKIEVDNIIPDRTLSISRGGIVPLGEFRDIWIFKKIDAILKRSGFALSTPIKELSDEVLEILFFGDKEPVAVSSKKYPGTDWNTKYEGIINFLEKQKDNGTEKIQKWIKDFTSSTTCPTCDGARLKKESLHFKIADKNIAELARLNIKDLSGWFEEIEDRLTDRQNVIATEILKEIRKRLGFLLDVGLNYLELKLHLGRVSGCE